MKKIFVTGACGYKAGILIPKLLNNGYQVRGIDTGWFGNHLSDRENYELVIGDIQNIDQIDMSDIDAIIHLASIANDPTGDLDPKMTWETNCLATMKLADAAASNNVKHFIFASSGSVYGIKEEAQVTEDLSLVPISEYNKTKMVAERVLLSYQDKMRVTIFRPATVCGLSPRMRLDVSVNLLTMSALTKKKITVFGGKQIRPNVHIEDIADAYLFALSHDRLDGIFNIGFENLSIIDIANMVAEKLNVPIEITPSSDPRSYRVNSDKIVKAGFSPKKTVNNAIDEIIQAYQTGRLKQNDQWYNLNWMKKNVIKQL